MVSIWHQFVSVLTLPARCQLIAGVPPVSLFCDGYQLFVNIRQQSDICHRFAHLLKSIQVQMSKSRADSIKTLVLVNGKSLVLNN